MKIHSKSAMTLMELIVASILVGIVTLGLIAAEQAVRMSRQSSNRDSKISSMLQSVMLLLSKDASLTVGDASNTGIYQSTLVNEMAICFRHANGDANSYSDDLWNCWTAIISTGLLSSCDSLANPVDSCSGEASRKDWGILKFSATYTTFYSVLNDTGAVIPPAGSITAKISYINLTLNTRYNIAKDVHPIENPEYTISSHISPPGLSR